MVGAYTGVNGRISVKDRVKEAMINIVMHTYIVM